jgi:hypothetical protein
MHKCTLKRAFSAFGAFILCLALCHCSLINHGRPSLQIGRQGHMRASGAMVRDVLRHHDEGMAVGLIPLRDEGGAALLAVEVVTRGLLCTVAAVQQSGCQPRLSTARLGAAIEDGGAHGRPGRSP